METLNSERLEDEVQYLKRCYEDKSGELHDMVVKYHIMKREKELAENYADKLIHFVEHLIEELNIRNVQIPPFP